MCNGPSLLETDFDLLHRSGVFTLGLNKVNLLFDRTSLRPSAIVAVNPYVIEQNAAFYNDTEIPLYLDRNAMRFVTRRRTITYLPRSEEHTSELQSLMSIPSPVFSLIQKLHQN